jgi:hypothetical protein
VQQQTSSFDKATALRDAEMSLVQLCIPSDQKGWDFLKKRLTKGWTQTVDITEDTIIQQGLSFSKTQFAKNPHFRSCIIKACRPHLGKVYVAVSAGNGKLNVRFQEWMNQKSSDAASVSMAPTATDALTEAETEALAVDAVVETPAAQAVVETPAAQAVVETPAAEAVVEAPTAQAVVEAPAAEAVVDAPAAEAVVDAPTAQAVVDAPAPATPPQKKKTLPPLGRPVKPKGESGGATAWGTKKNLGLDF